MFQMAIRDQKKSRRTRTLDLWPIEIDRLENAFYEIVIFKQNPEKKS